MLLPLRTFQPIRGPLLPRSSLSSSFSHTDQRLTSVKETKVKAGNLPLRISYRSLTSFRGLRPRLFKASS